MLLAGFCRNALHSPSISVLIVFFLKLLCPQLRVSTGFANVYHSFPSSVTLLHLVKGLRNLLKAERLIHHGPDLNKIQKQGNIDNNNNNNKNVPSDKLTNCVSKLRVVKHASKCNIWLHRAAVK